MWFIAEFTPAELPHTSFRRRLDELLGLPVYVFFLRKCQRDQISTETHWGVNIPNFIINTWIIWCLHLDTHTHCGATYLQYLRCSLPHPHGSGGGAGANRQQRMPGLAQLYKQSCKEKSPATVAQSSPVLIPHYLHSRQTHSSCSRTAFTLLSSIWQESGHVASLLLAKNPLCIVRLQFIFFSWDSMTPVLSRTID